MAGSAAVGPAGVDFAGIFGASAAQDGTIIVGAVTGAVYGPTTDGKLRWIHDGPPLQAMRLDGKTLYLGLEQQIVALDLRR